MKCQNEGCVYSKGYMGTYNMVVLSYHDKPRKVSDVGLVLDYDRTTRWKCPNGHLSYEESIKVAEKPTTQDFRDDSPKRFHRKGFTGHLVNRYLYESPYSPSETNHQRHLTRKAQP